MHKRHLYCCISIFILILMKFAEADVSLRVFTKDEGLNNNEISRPRFYIQNFGTEPLSNFYCYYYFSIENSKTPQVEDYYTPDASISLENMGNGNHRVKFLFSGITINPGQTLPNPDGEVIGLHYTDYSIWDKTNDYSNTKTNSFELNGNMPVYSSNGVLIYGNEPGITAPPPQPPRVNTETANYAILSSEFTDLRDGSEIKGGDAGSNEYLEAGCDVVVRGSLFSGRSMFLRERAHIYNDVIAIGEIREQNGIVVEGTKRSNAQLQIPSIKSVSVSPGTKDTIIPNNSVCTLAPGNYRDVQVFSRSVITLMPGDYIFNQFRIEPHVSIILKASNNQRINIKSAGEIRFADSTVMIFEGDTAFPYSINIESAQTGQLFIGNDCQIYGSITAPNAEVHVYSRTQFYGAIFGKKVIIERNSIVCKPPVLLDLWHSEWAMAPPFTSSIFDYNAVVPDLTSTLIFKPVASRGSIISINGFSSDTITLTGSETDVAIRLNNPDQCGTTTYNVNVKKASNYQIFVNDDSPCSVDNEDGLSWGTAFKSLQRGIDKASQDGKEIWVAEGVYKPTLRTMQSDARSATFILKPGIEIKGGFNGTETINKPSGSFYNTTLSGDLSGNDDSISVWPPIFTEMHFLSDNVHHVVTIGDYKSSTSIKLSGLVITGGMADGIGDDGIGAGIFNMSASPTIEWCGIIKNYSNSSGAGIYDGNGFKQINNCLFKQNISNKGFGGGLYQSVFEDTVKIISSVFYSNFVNDTIENSGGGACHFSGNYVDLTNCLFTNNNAHGKGGAIFNSNVILNIKNCTISSNSALKGSGGIKNFNSHTTILNTILWNDNDTLSDSCFNITYSCIKGGFTGEGNISTDPIFLNINTPEGADGIYGTLDDGLMINLPSGCIGTGSNTGFPELDFLGYKRFGPSSDIGAYAFQQNNNDLIGIISQGGEFVPTPTFPVVTDLIEERNVNSCLVAGYGRVLQIELPKDEYTDKKSQISVEVVGIDAANSIIGTPQTISFYRVGSSQFFRSYYNEANRLGKIIVFTDDNEMQGEFTYAHVVMGAVGGKVRISVARKQFK